MLNNDIETGIALSGGGLQGFAHIGALKALEELGIRANYISGTSTGSAIASLYAMGYEPDEIEKICKKDYKKILKIRKRVLCKMAVNYLLYNETRVEGIIDGKVITDFINNAAVSKKIDLITDVKNKKLAIATVDSKSMKECIFVSDNVKEKDENVNYISNINIGTAVRSSMAFPAIFTTSNFNEYNFLDGGTIDNLPAKVLKDMGAKKVISIGFDVTHYEPSKNLEEVIIRTLDIFSYPAVKSAQQLSDISLEISNPDTSLLTMDDIEKTVDNGYNTVMENKEKIFKIYN